MLDRKKAPPSSPILFEAFPKAQFTQLDSGVPVYHLNSGDQPVIKLDIRLKSGIWYETFPAISWLSAKILLEGSSTKDAKTLQDAFDRLGAFIEVEAGFDFVTFSILGMRKNFDEVLKLLSEVFNSPIFPEKEFRIIRDLRINELNLNDAKSNMYASKMIRKAVFGNNHPYGRTLRAESIESAELSQVKSYYSNSLFNQPEVFISGDVDEILLKQIGDLLKIPESSASAKISAEQVSQKELNIERPENLQSSIRMAWMCPQKSSNDYHDFSIANTAFGGYFGSRLMKKIREEKGYTYGISSYPIHFQHDSFCIVGTDVKAEYTDATIGAIKDEIGDLQNNGITDEEIASVTNYLAGKFQSSLSTPFKIMDKFKQIHDHGLGYEFYESFYEALGNFTSEKMVEISRKYFDLESAHVVVVGKIN